MLRWKFTATVVGKHILILVLCTMVLLGSMTYDNISSSIFDRTQDAQIMSTCQERMPPKFHSSVDGKKSNAAGSVVVFDFFDRKNFKPNLRADCPYHDEKNGLFKPDTPSPRYIVTGGAGFIGSHLAKTLRDEGIQTSQIKVVDNLWRGRLANLQYSNGTWAINSTADFCALDLRNKEDTMRYIRGADYIYHLAGIVPDDKISFRSDRQDLQQTLFLDNILIDANTLQAAKQNGIPNYIYPGKMNSKGLQEISHVHILNQSSLREPESVYEWSKIVGEHEAHLAKDSGAFNVGLLRFQDVYGPSRDFTRNSSKVVPALINKALNHPNEPFVIPQTGKEVFDFLYIDDVVRALLLTKERGMNMGVIHLCAQRVITLHELALKVAELVEKKKKNRIEVTFSDCKLETDQKLSTVDCQRAKYLLDWVPEISFREGLEKMVNIWQENSKQPSVLVIVMGQARGSKYAWKSLFHHLVEPYGAHLATFFTDSSPQTPLQQNAQYNWLIPEPPDWGIYFEQASQLCTTEPQQQKEWQSFCEIKKQWLGGVKICRQPGSSGILLAFRWLVAQKILSLNLLQHYDYFVMTRADFLYLCDHVPFSSLDPHFGYVPAGEGYGGYTDRHLVGSPKTFFQMINITQQMLCNVPYYKTRLNRSHPKVNLEKTQRIMWTDLKIPIKTFNRSFFSVKLPEDPTSWMPGKQHDILAEFGNLTVKYGAELEQSLENCNVDLKAKMLEIDNLKD